MPSGNLFVYPSADSFKAFAFLFFYPFAESFKPFPLFFLYPFADSFKPFLFVLSENKVVLAYLFVLLFSEKQQNKRKPLKFAFFVLKT